MQTHQSKDKQTYTTRFTKFPYIFWAFGKEKQFSIKNGKLSIENNDKSFAFKSLSRPKFYAIKYIFPVIIFAVIFRPYDFYFNDEYRLLSHLFSIFLVIILLLSNGFARIALLIAGMVLVLGVSFYIDILSIISFVVKYVSFYYVFLMMFVDKDFSAYSVIYKGNVVSNFLIHKKLDNLSEK